MLKKTIFLFLLTLAAMLPAHAAENDTAIHDEIRAFKGRMLEAIQRRDIDAMLAMTTDEVAFTAMDNVPLHGKKEVRAYYSRMMEGAESIVTDMQITLEPDVLSALYDDGQVAVSTGDSTVSFKLRAGLEFTAPLRWTTAMIRDHGEWKIASAHFSANMFDNPLEGFVKKYVWAIVAIALGLGLIAGFWVGRRKRS
jgi:ketosteroid isomerase-like protein